MTTSIVRPLTLPSSIVEIGSGRSADRNSPRLPVFVTKAVTSISSTKTPLLASAVTWPVPTLDPAGQALAECSLLTFATSQRAFFGQPLPFQMKPFGSTMWSLVLGAGWPVPLTVPPWMPSVTATGRGFFLVPALAGVAVSEASMVVLVAAAAGPATISESAHTSAPPRTTLRNGISSSESVVGFSTPVAIDDTPKVRSLLHLGNPYPRHPRWVIAPHPERS